MKEYLDLCLQGKITIPTRKILLDKKKESLELTEKELDDNIDYINWKQNC